MTGDDFGGPLAPLAVGYRRELQTLGHSPLSEKRHMGLLAHLSEWIAAQGIAPADVTPAVLTTLLAERERFGWRLITPVGARPLFTYLRRLQVIPEARKDPGGPLAPLLARYHTYLVQERGLRPGTVVNYERAAQLFLEVVGVGDESELGSLSMADISRFVIKASKPGLRISPRDLMPSLRAFLRFLHIRGVTKGPLAPAVPSYRSWRGGQLPRSPAPHEVERLLRSCDTRTACGRRDRAVLLLLSRLGLRAGEVAAMSLDDIDWRAGDIVVHGKGPRIDRLPLPADVGAGLADYLRDGRPPGTGRHLFLTARAPLAGLSRGAITCLVVTACHRAGVAPVGAHQLRHAAATAMLRSGASLREIGQVLRHRSVNTTAIYAKVDHASLGLVARPWPGAVA